MTVGELRRLLVDINLPDNTNICHLPGQGNKEKIDCWFVRKSENRDEYELVLVTAGKTKMSYPPPIPSDY